MGPSMQGKSYANEKYDGGGFPSDNLFFTVGNPTPSYFSLAYDFPCIEGTYISLGVLFLPLQRTPPSWGGALELATALTLSCSGICTPPSEIWSIESSLTISCLTLIGKPDKKRSSSVRSITDVALTSSSSLFTPLGVTVTLLSRPAL